MDRRVAVIGARHGRCVGVVVADVWDPMVVEFAKELVKALAGGVVSVAGKVPELFARMGRGKRDRVAAQIEQTVTELAEVPADQRPVVAGVAERLWAERLGDLLAEHPDAGDDVAAVLAELRRVTAAMGQVTVYQQRVEGFGSGAQGPGATAHTHNYGARPAPGGLLE